MRKVHDFAFVCGTETVKSVLTRFKFEIIQLNSFHSYMISVILFYTDFRCIILYWDWVSIIWLVYLNK